MKFAVAFAISMFLPSIDAQEPGRHFTVIRGTVKGVDAVAKRLSMVNEPIPGGMGAMTMSYKVDSDEVLNRLKPGDRIEANFMEASFTLSEVRLMPVEQLQKLAIKDLEQLALANNPTVAQFQAHVQAAAGFARQAGLYPNPTLGYYSDEIRGGYYSGGKQGGYISQTIVTGGKLQAALRTSELRSRETQVSAEIQRQRILTDIRTLFYQVLANQRLVEVRRELAKLAADSALTSHQLANIGQADRPDVLQAEVEEQQATVSLHVAERNLRSSWRVLAASVGKPDLAPIPLEGDLENIPDLSYESWLSKTLAESPEIKLAQQSAERAEAALTQARKAPIPDLEINANLAQNNEPLESTHRPTGLNAGVQIGVQLPLFNRNQGNISAARAEVEVAKQEVARIKLQIARGMANQFRDYESARATVQQYRTEILPRAREAYELYSANYRKMSGAYPQALMSQRTLFQLQVEYVRALSMAWQSSVEIQGFGLVDGLSGPR